MALMSKGLQPLYGGMNLPTFLEALTISVML